VSPQLDGLVRLDGFAGRPQVFGGIFAQVDEFARVRWRPAGQFRPDGRFCGTDARFGGIFVQLDEFAVAQAKAHGADFVELPVSRRK
jgi:hypothetical protein